MQELRVVEKSVRPTLAMSQKTRDLLKFEAGAKRRKKAVVEVPGMES